jgi:hypothetical protein
VPDRNGRERDPANTGHTIEPIPLGPIGEFGWEADIRSSRLNDASAPRRDIRRLPLLAANRGRKRSCPHRHRTRPEASENW